MNFFKTFPLFLAFAILMSCSTAEKRASLPLKKTKKDRPEEKISREIAHLKSVSEFEGRNWQFITKKMKEVIKNYSKMKSQLDLIESQMESLLQNKAVEGSGSKEAREKDLEKSPLEEESSDVFLKETPLEQSQKEAIEKIEKSPSSMVKAQKLFKDGEYEKAISFFQKYRNENHKGPLYLRATFYIGLSFKKLKMPIEAKVFFEEIASSQPQSLWGQKARKLLEE